MPDSRSSAAAITPPAAEIASPVTNALDRLDQAIVGGSVRVQSWTERPSLSTRC
jgi:hypothetical protein